MGNKGCLTVLLVGFAAVGVLLAYVWLASVFEAIRTRTWDEAPGEILSNEGKVDQAASDYSEPFVYRMRYRYRYQGQVQESEQSGRAADWSEIAGRLKKYPPGAQATVHVNPRQPKHNYLELPSLWVIAFFPLPLAFLAAMLYGLHYVWFGRSAESRPRQPRRLEGRGLVIMFGLFTLVGGGIFIGLVLEPATRALGSRQWPQTTCTVEFSRVGTHTGGSRGGSRTYSIDVLFSYHVGGSEYRSSHYDLEHAASGDSTGKQAVVNRLSPGTRVNCYYDPSDPQDAVLDRSFPSLILLGLIPLFLFVVGAVGLVRRAPGLMGRR